jgi:TPP-dependent pyruvate/acetoin dehydrogenase alpha subunit
VSASAEPAFRSWSAAQPVSAGTRGVEDLVAGAVAGVSKRVWLFPGRRERGAAILRGADAERIDAARPWKVVPPGASPSARALQAVGVAVGGEAALCFLGTGSLGYGAAQEALQLAAAHRAPVVFVLSWYTDGPFAAPLAVEPGAFAQALGLQVARASGADAGSVQAAVAAVGAGPAMVVVEMPHA